MPCLTSATSGPWRRGSVRRRVFILAATRHQAFQYARMVEIDDRLAYYVHSADYLRGRMLSLTDEIHELSTFELRVDADSIRAEMRTLALIAGVVEWIKVDERLPDLHDPEALERWLAN